MRGESPSTSGWMVLERRDFSDATNSVVCSTGFAASVTISTGIGGGAPPGGHRPVPPAGCRHTPRPMSSQRQQRTKSEYLGAHREKNGRWS